MNCEVCQPLLGSGERSDAVEEHLRACPECQAVDRDLSANAIALETLRSEAMPALVMKIPRRRPYGWVAAAAAAGLLIGMLAPRNAPPVRRAVSSHLNKTEPLRIKMLTPDPDVVIYWIVESPQGE